MPYAEIVRLVWPLALGMVNNAVMQFVDRAYLAHSSLAALEAVLPAGMLMWIFAGFFQSVVGYSSVLVGVGHGASDHEQCRDIYRAAKFVAFASALLSLPLVPLGRHLLALAAPGPQALALERDYFTITMAGAFAVYLQMAAAAYFTGRGRTRPVFWVNLAGNALNIVLDPVLIFVCGWGIAGAAAATVASMFAQAVALGFAAEREMRREGAPTSFAGVRRQVGRMLRFGVPSGAYTVLNILSFTIFVFVTGGVGELELAASNACFTVNYLLFAPMEGFSIGASTLVAQAIGRGDLAAARADARRTILLGVGLVAALSLVVVVCSGPILSIFASQAGERTEEFMRLGFVLLLIMAAWQVFDAADVIVSGALKGAGDTHFVMTWMLVTAFLFWLPLVFAVRHWHNTMPALWGTMVVYVVVICIGSFIRWRRGSWTLRFKGRFDTVPARVDSVHGLQIPNSSHR